MTTIDNIMALAYKLRDARTYEWDVSEAVEADRALRTALTEALAQPIQTLGCTSNCENCTYAHGSPAHAGYCYMFYDEPQGVCGQWKDANHSVSVNDMVAQPVREPLQDALAWELWLNAVDTANNTGRLVAYTYKEAIERAHNIRGEK